MVVNILLPIEVADVCIFVSVTDKMALYVLLRVLLLLLMFHFVLDILVSSSPRLVVIRVLRGVLVAILTTWESALTRIILARLAFMTTA